MRRRRDGAGVERGRGREAGIRVPGPGGGAVCEVRGDDHPVDADAPGASVLPSGTPVIRSWQGGATGAPKSVGRRHARRQTKTTPPHAGRDAGVPSSHHRRRSTHASPISETRTLKRLMPDSSGQFVAVIQMRTSTKCRPRAAGVSDVIRPRASSVIRSQTWWPSGASSASNQQVSFGSRVESGFSRRPPSPPACLRSRLPTAAGHRAGLCGCRRSPLRAVRVAPNGTPPADGAPGRLRRGDSRPSW